jgi:hypothetical protein
MELSVSVGRLPKQLATSRELPSLGMQCQMEIRREVEVQLEAYEILYLLTVLKKESMNLILVTRYLVTVAAIIV